MKYNIIGYGLAPNIQEELLDYSSLFNYYYEHVESNEQLIRIVQRMKYNQVFVCIDIDSDKTEKIKITTALKAYENVTVIFISENSDPNERLRWLNFGALAYVIKPFQTQELVIHTINLTNYKGTNQIIDNNFTIDLQKNTIIFNDKEIKTTPSIFNLIIYFVEHEGQIISREQIMTNVLNTHDYLTSRNVDTLIKELRKKTTSNIVSTIRGVGYKYNSDITPDDNQQDE